MPRERQGYEIRPLLSNGAVIVVAAALKETMLHHAVREYKKQDKQNPHKHDFSNPKPKFPTLPLPSPGSR